MEGEAGGSKAEDKKVVISGGGSKSVGFLTQFHDVGVIDHVVIVMNSVYMDEIGKMLNGMGVDLLMLGL
jgi:malic enzyme